MRNFGFVLGFCALIFALSGLGGCMKRTPEEKMDWVSEKITDKLELDKLQEARLKDLMDTVKQVRQTHKNQTGGKKEQLKAMLLSDHLNQAEVRALLNEKQNQISASFDLIYPKFEAFHASLRPEQKQLALEYFEKFSKKFNHD